MDTLYNPVIPPRPFNLRLTVIPQGFYNYLSNRLYRKTDILVELRQSVSPYALLDSVTAPLDSASLTCKIKFLEFSDSMYYLVVKHKNCLETWSSNTVRFTSDTTVYNFTTGKNMAYGSNQKQVDSSPLRFGILSGNVNGDAIIDAADLSAVENDAEAGMAGNVITDLTGDYFVDANDLSITENNALAEAIVVTP